MSSEEERFEYAIELVGKGFIITMINTASIQTVEGGYCTLFENYEEAVKQYAILRRRYESMGAEETGRKLVIRKRRIVTTTENWNQVLGPSQETMKSVLTTPSITNALPTEGAHA